MSEQVPLREFYEKIRNIEGFYQTLSFNGLYLPSFSSKCISGDYLWRVFTKEVFTLKREEMREGFPTKKLLKEELLDLLERVLLQKGKKPTGLKVGQLPNKEWLVNCIFTVDPSNTLFKVPVQENIIQREVNEGQFSNLDFSMATGQIRSFLRLTNKEKLTQKVIKKERKIVKKQKVLKKYETMLSQKQKELNEEEEKLQILKQELNLAQGAILDENPNQAQPPQNAPENQNLQRNQQNNQ